MEKWFGAWFIFCAILGVAWIAFIVWVILTVVNWLVTK